jgi:glycosyltransferase involved in cell wall biosynthesis
MQTTLQPHQRQEVRAFWTGPSLSLYEQLSLTSFVASGARVQLFSYDDDLVVPDGVELVDANEILPGPIYAFSHPSRDRSLALHSDLFRYVAIEKYGGWYVDADVVFIGKEMPGSSIYIARESEKVVNGAVMKFPAHSPLLITAIREARRLLSDTGKSTSHEARLLIGPSLVTRLIGEFALDHMVQPRSSAYEIGYDEIVAFFDPASCERLQERVANSDFTHLWNEVWRWVRIPKNYGPPEGSFLDSLFRRFGVKTPPQARLSYGTVTQWFREHHLLQDIKYRIGDDRLPADAMDQLSAWFQKIYGWHGEAAPELVAAERTLQPVASESTPEPAASEPPPDVTLVLNLHREAGFALRTLMSIKEAVAFASVHGISTQLIVVLDRPDDKTREALSQFDLSGFSNHQTIEVNFGSLGLARNVGCARARGRYICLCDGDDLYSFNSIAAMFGEAERLGPRAILVAEWLLGFGAQYFFVQHVDLDCVTPLSFLDIHPYVSAIFFDRDLFGVLQYEDLRPTSGFAYEDWHFNAEAVALGYSFYVAPDVIRFYRQRPDSLLAQTERLSVRQIPASKLFDPEVFVKICRESVEDLRRGSKPQPKLKGRDFFDDAVSRYLIAAANRIDPEIDLEPFMNSEEYIVSRASRLEIGSAYFDICKSIGNKVFSHVFLTPWVTRGGADRYLVNIINTLASLKPEDKALVILGELGAENAWLRKISETATIVDLSQYLAAIGEHGVDLITLKLIQSCAVGATLHLRTSAYAFRFYRSFGRALSDHKSIVYFFGLDTRQDSEFFITMPFAFSFISENEANIRKFITDSETSATFTQERTCTAKKWFLLPTLCNPALHRAKVVSRARNDSKKILWASRLTQQKRPHLLIEIARALSEIKPDLAIEVWGAADASFDVGRLTAIPNLEYKGEYDSFEAVAAADFLGFLYTSYFDGVPTALLEAAGHGLPLVAPDVGGVAEFVSDDDTGLLLPSLASETLMAASYAKSFARLADDPDLRTRLAGNAYDRLVCRHSFEPYVKSVTHALELGNVG